jgi:cell division protein ZapA (FtsZ GTPase activity inhibitor)
VKRKVELTLLGQRFSVRSDRDESYVQSLAGFVGRRFEEVKRVSRGSNSEQLSLLLALNLADELFQAEERAAASRDQIRQQTANLVDKLSRALAAAEAETSELDTIDAQADDLDLEQGVEAEGESREEAESHAYAHVDGRMGSARR